MDPFIAAALIGAGGQLLANQQTAGSARSQMQFQERMSSTAYQRAVQDMREAGLNPILAAKVGGASSPAGAMSQYGNIGASAVQAYGGASQAFSSQEGGYLSRAQANMADMTAEKIVAETANVRSQQQVIINTAGHLKELIAKVGQETRTNEQQQRVLEAQVRLIAEQIKDTDAAAALKNADVEFIKLLDKQVGAGGSQFGYYLQLLIRMLKK